MAQPKENPVYAKVQKMLPVFIAKDLANHNGETAQALAATKTLFNLAVEVLQDLPGTAVQFLNNLQRNPNNNFQQCTDYSNYVFRLPNQVRMGYHAHSCSHAHTQDTAAQINSLVEIGLVELTGGEPTVTRAGALVRRVHRVVLHN